MCGLAGWVGAPKARQTLTMALAMGADTRGGHACGYVALNGRTTFRRYGKSFTALPTSAWDAMLKHAETAHTMLLHGRYATCGIPSAVAQAHPYPVGGLLIAHNGIVYDAEDLAARNKRRYVTDSYELAHLVAASAWDEIGTLSGYGTIMWTDGRSVFLVRASDDAQLDIGETADGSVLWASTAAILGYAAKTAGVELAHQFEPETGMIVEVNSEGCFDTGKRVEFMSEKYDWRDWKDPGDVEVELDWTTDAEWLYWNQNERLVD